MGLAEMNKLLIIGMVALLAGCNNVEKTVVEKGNGNSTKVIYTLDNKPLECIVKGAYKMSCNWEKHNKLFEGE